jgi:hypothetical protein
VDAADSVEPAKHSAESDSPQQARGSRAAVILGNDAVVAARPCSPAQLARACRAAGFDIVVPPSWGDELIADGYLAQLAARRESVVVACACARVTALLTPSSTAEQATHVAIAAPPVAAARYLRLVYGEALLVTYVGDCPSANDASIDARFTPAGFFASLHRQGITLDASSPTQMDETETDRWRRHRSMPGGLPARRFLSRAPVDRVLREADIQNVDAAAWKTSRSRVLLDLADAAGCACGGNRAQVEDGEPTRSATPILVEPPGLSLRPEPTARRARIVGHATRPASSVPPPRDRDAASTVPSRSAAKPGAPPEPVVAATAAPVANPSNTVPDGPRPASSGVVAPVRPAATASASGARDAASARTTTHSATGLLAIPAIVLALTAALGIAAYVAGAASTPRRGPPVPERSTLSGETASRDSAARAPVTSGGSTTMPPPQPAPAPAPRDSAPLSSPATPSGVVGPNGGATAPGRLRRRQVPELVPGWLPQGDKAWTPADTIPRRPDTSGVVPPKPDTIPRA